MPAPFPKAQSFDRFTVASANLLIETNTEKDRHLRIPPQHERIDAHLTALREVEKRTGRPLDVVGVQELQITTEHDNSETLRSGLHADFSAHMAHSRKRVGEHIGAIGRVPDDHEFLELSKNRFAAVLRFGHACIVNVHLAFNDADVRKRQFGTLMEYVREEDHAVVMGDFNEEDHFFTTRHQLGRIGFESAFIMNKKGHPVTLPAPGYGKYRSFPRRAGYMLLGGGIKFDDIYVKGDIRTKETGLIASESDHYFVYASLFAPQGIFSESPES